VYTHIYCYISLQKSDVAQVGHIADTSFLSHFSEVSSHFRVVPSSSFQAVALANLAYNTFSWRRVFVVYSSTSSGLDALAVFEMQAAQYGIEIIGILGMIPSILKTVASEQRYADSIQRLKLNRIRIFVLLLDDENVAKKFIDTATNYNLLDIDTVILGNAAISNSNLWNFTNSVQKTTYEALNNALAGYIGVQEIYTDWMPTQVGQDFITRYRKRPNTRSIVNGVPICSNATDDDGNKLWERNLISGVACAGSDYSSYAKLEKATGYEAYIYDATVSLVEGIISYCKLTYPSVDGYNIPSKISGRMLVEYLVNNFSMPLTTGTIQFSSGIEALNNYGFGDRTYNVRYSIVNFNASTKSIDGFQLNRIGTWTSEGGYKSCFGDPFFSQYGSCAALNWGTLDNSKPSDRDNAVTQTMPSVFKNLVIALAVILFLCFLFIAIVFYKYRHTRLLKASQIPMMAIILLSTLFACVRVVIISTDVSASRCEVEYWMGNSSFAVVIALFAKTLRFHEYMDLIYPYAHK
jgi:hypothetical protein